jgi:hypothetical protein
MDKNKGFKASANSLYPMPDLIIHCTKGWATASTSDIKGLGKEGVVKLDMT